MTATPLVPWVVCKDCGEVLAAHCMCMVGYVLESEFIFHMTLNIILKFSLSEACSHIAAAITCLVKAHELQTKSGLSACTSKVYYLLNDSILCNIPNIECMIILWDNRRAKVYKSTIDLSTLA